MHSSRIHFSSRSRQQTGQRGVALIEALISLLILALGVLGLAAVQTRMLVDTRTTNSRAVAIRLIGDLADRIRLNAQGAQPSANLGNPSLSLYADGGPTGTPTSFPTYNAQSLALNCPGLTDTGGCSKTNQALYDVAVWRQNLANTLMNGRASIWQVSPRQLQVVVAWQANESTNNVLGGTPNTQVADPLQITAAPAGALCNANSGYICHIDFIDLPPAF